ncbi:chloramphenicol acetyltransferase [Flectobacillus longus]|uniref:chloramphenicol acetyltransferase n=1 Tax=Flectobacillus longus TaxID=2984207 RepID=UPI0024B790B8|nr:chloramphenicol acetyltransferase [Flectobacillus longus]MDI9881791.1 chloramphenicol acetyltransferase [Flectobacillus longus]
MKQLINLEEWDRKEHYLFFSKFEEPFYGVTVKIDCTIAYQKAKENGKSFFWYYLYRSLKAANEIENFRYRIIENNPYCFDTINASPTIGRPNGTFGFGYVDYDESEEQFYQNAKNEIDRVLRSTGLMPAVSGENVIHFSAIPWLDFTSISHARSFSFPDSCPKISFGKMMEKEGQKSMSVSIHVHHALVDGYHVGLYVDRFQALMNEF